MPNLNEVLTQISVQLNLDADELIAYAAEDTLGGYHIDESQRVWPMGSVWADEGKILYALTRALKAHTVVQIGGWVGCSAAHFAAAVKANGGGRVVSVDNGGGGVMHGSLIPSDLLDYVELVAANGEDWLAEQGDNTLELVFEDAGHSRESVGLISRIALQKLQEGGVLVNHDAAHDIAFVGGEWTSRTVERDGVSVVIKEPPQVASGVGYDVRSGLEDAGARFRPYRTDESDCGLAVSVKGTRGFARDVHSVKVEAPAPDLLNQLLEQAQALETSEPSPQVKGKPGRKAKAKA